MPRYFFDTDDGEFQDRDEEGHDVADLDGARRLALQALLDMARDGLVAGGDRQQFSISVRDDAGTIAYTARLLLEAQKLALPRAAA